MPNNWSSRPPVYKLGVAGVLVTSIMFVVGSSVPFWLGGANGNSGLWTICYTVLVSTECVVYGPLSILGESSSSSFVLFLFCFQSPSDLKEKGKKRES